ncbi:MAG: exopolysaccharide biosynthesis protein [Geminicoccaceae bacterium]|nr:exopolysaccharide biosynthesis protein [Geminicoccaceae bacterium]MCX8099933.1 exopolysaccharide biosynthesis protein [Geminicoccaceae bacterium]MDW8369554.1 exopolysaccharide biosynthesis protein [Geminicoccaceae bacterium]
MADLAATGAYEPRRQAFSSVLRSLAQPELGERVTVAEIVGALGDRAFGAVLLIFAAPNILPVTLPGTSSVTALPILLVGVQLLLGWRRLHLPQALARRSFLRRQLAVVVERLGPWLERAERLARPRFPALTSPLAERLYAVPILVLSVVLFLPLPLSNIPPGIALSILGLGLLERDGGFVLAGLGAGGLALFVFSTVTTGLIELGFVALRAAFF